MGFPHLPDCFKIPSIKVFLFIDLVVVKSLRSHRGVVPYRISCLPVRVIIHKVIAAHVLIALVSDKAADCFGNLHGLDRSRRQTVCQSADIHSCKAANIAQIDLLFRGLGTPFRRWEIGFSKQAFSRICNHIPEGSAVFHKGLISQASAKTAQ